jgi:hypothetical protein
MFSTIIFFDWIIVNMFERDDRKTLSINQMFNMLLLLLLLLFFNSKTYYNILGTAVLFVFFNGNCTRNWFYTINPSTKDKKVAKNLNT